MHITMPSEPWYTCANFVVSCTPGEDDRRVHGHAEDVAVDGPHGLKCFHKFDNVTLLVSMLMHMVSTTIAPTQDGVR